MPIAARERARLSSLELMQWAVSRAANDAAAAVAEAAGEEDADGHPEKRAEMARAVAREIREIEPDAATPLVVQAERAGPTSPSAFRERMATMRAVSQSSGETTPGRSSLESIEASLEATSSVLVTLLITPGSTHGNFLDVIYAPSVGEVLYVPSRDAAPSKDSQGQQGLAAEASEETEENEATEATEANEEAAVIETTELSKAAEATGEAVESAEVPEESKTMQTPDTTEATEATKTAHATVKAEAPEATEATTAAE
jgi:hypothetical protein